MDILHVGLGVRGRRWLDLVRAHPGLRSVGCVDTDPAALQRAKTDFSDLGAACYASLEDALTHTKAEAAIVASPVPVRGGHAEAALAAGLSVMVEKPFAASIAEATRALEASRRSGRPVMVAQNYRFAPCERTLRELVREGKVGTVTHVSAADRRSTPAMGAERGRMDYAQLLRAAAHHFDSLRSILGVNAHTAISRSSTAPWSPYEHGSTTEAVLEMEGGVYVQYHGTLTSNRTEHSLWIEGDKGALWTDRTRVWWRKRGWPLFVPIGTRKVPRGDDASHPRQGTASLLEQFRAATLEQRTAETSGDDNVWTLAIIEAAILSDKTGRVAQVSDLLAAADVPRSSSAANVQGGS